VPILPPQFDTHPAFELLIETEAGRIGFDHRLLRSLLARPDETLAALVRFTAEKRADALLDLDEQVFDLFRQLNSPQAIPFYLRRIEQAEEGIPDELVEAFAVLGAPAVDPLLDAIARADEDDRGDLVFLLAALGVRDARIPALLEGVLEADPYEGALCAGLYGDPALDPLLERALAALPAGEASQQERKALEECRAQLRAGETVRDVPVFDIFPLYPETASPLFESLPEDQVEEYLSCDFPEYRREAALSLCDEEYNEDTRDALLRQARADLDPQVRAACLRALGSVCDADAAVRDFLFETLARADLTPDERASTVVALANGPGSSALHDAIHALYEIPATRADALEAMWRSHDLRYRRYIGENLRDSDARVRASAATAAGAFPIPELASELVPLFDDPESRQEALYSYALAVPGKTSSKSVEKLFEKIDELAGGLSRAEAEAVASALDTRLERAGLPPFFFTEEPEEPEQSGAPGAEHVHGPECRHDPAPAASLQAGRNEPCPCGSGKKFKKCHGAPEGGASIPPASRP
jgi:hypothetical protein